LRKAGGGKLLTAKFAKNGHKVRKEKTGLFATLRNSFVTFAEKGAHCRILGFTAEYNKSVRKFTATYVSPTVKMHPWTT
jgi:hypothetical protein